MKDWLYPGAKVVCHTHKFGDDGWWGEIPEIGRIYTVSNVYVAGDGDLMIELVELPEPDVADWYPGFVAANFRPLTKRNTDAQVQKLKALLNTTPNRETVDG